MSLDPGSRHAAQDRFADLVGRTEDEVPASPPRTPARATAARSPHARSAARSPERTAHLRENDGELASSLAHLRLINDVINERTDAFKYVLKDWGFPTAEIELDAAAYAAAAAISKAGPWARCWRRD